MKGEKKQKIGPVTKTLLWAFSIFLIYCIVKGNIEPSSPSAVESKNNPAKSIGMNIQVGGAYGEKCKAESLGTYYSQDQVYGMSFNVNNDHLYTSSGNTIYEIIDNRLVEIYRHEVQIHTIIGASDAYLLFDAPVKSEKEDRRKVDCLWIYYLSTGETRLLTTREGMRCSYDDNELIVSDEMVRYDSEFQIFTDLDGEINVINCSGVEELPDNYEVYVHAKSMFAIEKKIKNGTSENTLLTGEERDYYGQVVQQGGTTSQHRGNAGCAAFFSSQRVGKDTVYNVCRRFKGPWDQLRDWEYDVVEKYDMKSKTGTVIFKDDKNTIIGYNYATNVVYEVTPDYKLISKEIANPETISELVQLEPGEDIIFLWRERYLFWKYDRDTGEEFGGVIKL